MGPCRVGETGKKVFARTNGHFKRRRSHSQHLQTDAAKRYCMSCFVRHQKEIVDSEWHALFECPLNSKPRELFEHTYNLSQFGYHGTESDTIACLVNLISKAHTDVKLLDEVAYWVVGTLACRRREFKALCS